MKQIPLVDLAAVHEELGDELEAALLGVARSQGFIGGEHVARFEEEFAQTLGAKRVVAVANGTDALELAMRAMGVTPGSEVLLPANTFIATAEAVVAVGARPRFVDVDRASGLIDLDSAAERVTPATSAIAPVHLYGRIVDMDAVGAFAAEHGIEVIEDAAQAHGATFGGRAAGTIGRAGCFSFYPGKNLGAFGDAGAMATNDEDLADAVKLMRDHGRQGRDQHVVVGRNSRMDAMQAAVLRVKLPHLERWTLARRRAAERYRELLPAELLDWRADDPASESHHLFPILVEDRGGLAASLKEAGVATGVHYRAALTQTQAFADHTDPCPNAEWRAGVQLSLPMHPHLDDAAIERVVGAVLQAAPQAGSASSR
jgi:dTDP-4-amino-4,6-dideoxygalactose transaminase